MKINIQEILIDFDHGVASASPTYISETTFIVFALIISFILVLLIFFTIRCFIDHSKKIAELEKICKTRETENVNTASSLEDINK